MVTMPPSNIEPSIIPPMHSLPTPAQPSPALSIESSSGSDSDRDSRRPTRLDRPRMSSRIPSASIVVPKGHANIEISGETFPPDDARAMSPRRNSDDLERLTKETRLSLKEKARTLQSSLQALADRIDEVRSDHNKLEIENKFLQDYIGGLTRQMAKGDLGPNKSKK